MDMFGPGQLVSTLLPAVFHSPAGHFFPAFPTRLGSQPRILIPGPFISYESLRNYLQPEPCKEAFLLATQAVWFQNRRAKMRRQLKLQGQLAGPCVKRDNDETPEKASRSLKQQTEGSDSEHWERRQEGENYPWTKAAGAVLSVHMQSVSQRSGKWERPEGPSSEELRSCSIAKLRAKAREHEAEIQSTVNMSGGNTQSQTQEDDAMHNDG
ncbi:hypothetical protein FQN60_004001 [Etheostoma spectabile]|uniref:Homeobox domain-containing protein n=1 Tax=Etheostoma spectabile TaxID=54343 RepID=A0A5J5CUC9_9PERO|nr:hypothetical protein FQN60_004001 [Etheostoma spectabile]